MTTGEAWRILVVGAHPADVFDTAGGALAHHAERGDHVTALVLTQGARVHDVVITDELKRRAQMPSAAELDALIEQRMEAKRQEVRDACRIMGIAEVRFFNYDDSVLLVSEAIIQDIARVIREVRPHLVITHYPFDNNGIADQHAATGQMTLTAVNTAASVGRGDPNPGHRVAQVYFFATPIGLPKQSALAAETKAYPDVYVDITDVIERKIAAMMCLKSQQYDEAMTRKRIEAVDGCWGWFMRVPYAEAFIRHRPEMHRTLPITPDALADVVRTEGEMHATIRHSVSIKLSSSQ